MIGNITPVLLTYNEAPNIGRALEKLSWAANVIIVDSFSQDETTSIAGKFSNARLFQRKFDSHATQWNFALEKTGIHTEWVLALDSDYILTDDFVEELKGLHPNPETSGYRSHFTYCIRGRPLHASVYPPVIVLYRRRLASYIQDGHTQRLAISGKLAELNSAIRHDDRKLLRDWLFSQDRYMKLEADKLLRTGSRDLDWADRIRKLRVVSPLGMFLHCLFVKGLVFDGLAGFYYSFQRMIAESILSLCLIRLDLEKFHRE